MKKPLDNIDQEDFFSKKYLEAYINENIQQESVNAERKVVNIWRYLIPAFFMIPFIWFFFFLIVLRNFEPRYFFILSFLTIEFIYFLIIHKYIKRGKNVRIIRFINITIEITTVTFVIIILSQIYNAATVLTGPLVLVYILMVMMTGFRLSMRLNIFAGNMAAFQHLLVYFYFIGSVPEDLYVQLIDLGPSGIIQKTFYLILSGVISGLLALHTKKLILKIGTNSFETHQIKTTFGQYVSKEIRDYILNDKINVNGEVKHGVVLFSDIRNFTALLENKEPREVITRLNEYFTDMVEVIANNNGIVNKFIGDAIMAVFGLFDEKGGGELEAVTAAIEMQKRLNQLNDKWTKEDALNLKMGIGIDSGNFLTGNVGSNHRKEFTCIGDVVNTASRLEGYTKEYKKQIIISENVRNAICDDDKCLINEIGPIELKGKSKKVVVFEVKVT